MTRDGHDGLQTYADLGMDFNTGVCAQLDVRCTRNLLRLALLCHQRAPQNSFSAFFVRISRDLVALADCVVAECLHTRISIKQSAVVAENQGYLALGRDLSTAQACLL